MIYGYARVSTDIQSEAAQVRQHHAAGAAKVFREEASEANDPAQLGQRLPGWSWRSTVCPLC
jgi:DNA invertase Pin-like site-specific DNA recombinase